MTSSADSSQLVTKVNPFQIAKDLQDIIQGKVNNTAVTLR